MESQSQPSVTPVVASETRTQSPTRTSEKREKRETSPPPPQPSVKSRSGVVGETTTSINIRQFFSDEAESELNKLVNLFMVGGYQCIAMAAYFDRDEVGLFGVAHFCKWTSVEIYHCARIIMDYVVLRGGRVRLDKVDKPAKTEWKTPIDAMEFILDMKEMIYDKCVQLHKRASDDRDAHLEDFLEGVILRPLVACNRQLVVLVSNSKRAGPALGEYQFNKHLEQFLANIMRDPTLSHLAHGGTSYLNMYKPPLQQQPGGDFSAVFGALLAANPQLVNMDLHNLMHLVGLHRTHFYSH